MKRSAVSVATTIVILLVGLVAVELIFGSWLSKDPLAGLNLHRNERVTVDPGPLYAEGSGFVYQRDEWGFRGFPLDPAKVDIVTLGGTATDQLYLADHTTWQASLSRSLAESGRSVTVANAGVDGQTVAGLLFDIERWLPNVPGLKPRIVLACVGIGDAQAGPEAAVVDRLGYPGLGRRLRDQSAIVRLSRVVLGVVSAHEAPLMHQKVDFAAAKWTDKPNFPDIKAAHPQVAIDQYAARLAQVARRVRDMGAQPVFVTQRRADYRVGADGKVWGVAAAKGPNGVDEWRLLDALNRATLATCKAENATCLDLAGELRFEDGDFYDHIHTTPQGAMRIGRWMAEKLAPLL